MSLKSVLPNDRRMIPWAFLSGQSFLQRDEKLRNAGFLLRSLVAYGASHEESADYGSYGSFQESGALIKTPKQ